MKKISKAILLLASALMILSGCKPKQQVSATKVKPVMATAPVMIYKTKQDYSLHVPVTLSEDKKTVTSFPAPGDIYYGGDLAYPVALENGYLLDRRGINENSAFTKWTYYEYSRLSKTPSSEEIMNMILDKDPFTELYFCGSKSRFKDLENELNVAIKDNKLDQYKKLK